MDFQSIKVIFLLHKICLICQQDFLFNLCYANPCFSGTPYKYIVHMIISNYHFRECFGELNHAKNILRKLSN